MHSPTNRLSPQDAALNEMDEEEEEEVEESESESDDEAAGRASRFKKKAAR